MLNMAKVFQVIRVKNVPQDPALGVIMDFQVDWEGQVNGPDGLLTVGDVFGETFADRDTILRIDDDRFLFSPQDEDAAFELNPPKQKRQRITHQSLTTEQVQAILKDRAEQKLSFGKIGDNHGISTYTVQKVCRGTIYQDVESPHREAAFRVDRSSTRKLSDADVIKIRRLYKDNTSILQLALDHNCSAPLIKDIVLGRSYQDVIDPDDVPLVEPIDEIEIIDEIDDDE